MQYGPQTGALYSASLDRREDIVYVYERWRFVELVITRTVSGEVRAEGIQRRISGSFVPRAFEQELGEEWERTGRMGQENHL